MSVKSQKELLLEKLIYELIPSSLQRITKKILNDKEVGALQEYANNVSIRRLGFNDHGPVHMRQVVLNALRMATLLKKAHISLNMEEEHIGNFEDSLLVLVASGMLHDIGMTITRDSHEHYGAWMGAPILTRLLHSHFEDDIAKATIVRSMMQECIIGHMGTVRIHSLEAGIILIADGCDMEKGRARIPMLLNSPSRPGDIHKYSSSAVERVNIREGKRKPIHIDIEMSESVGFFQVEEVLYPKIDMSPLKRYVELSAHIRQKDTRFYL